MPARLPHGRRPSFGGSGLLRYVLAWTGAAVVVLAVALAVLGGEDDAVTLPPVRQVGLTAAVRSAHCELRTGDGWTATGLPVPGAAGGRATPPGVYEQPPDPSRVVSALRRGIVVIRYDPDLPDEAVDQLRELQEAVPAGTIVTPQPPPARHALSAIAWRRLLTCPTFSPATVEAIRLFRGRYLGSGPDRTA